MKNNTKKRAVFFLFLLGMLLYSESVFAENNSLKDANLVWNAKENKFKDAEEKGNGCAKSVGSGLIICNCDTCPSPGAKMSVYRQEEDEKGKNVFQEVGVDYKEGDDDTPWLYTPAVLKTPDKGKNPLQPKNYCGVDESSHIYCASDCGNNKKREECGLVLQGGNAIYDTDAGKYKYNCNAEGCDETNPYKLFVGPSGKRYTTNQKGECQVLNSAFQKEDVSGFTCWSGNIVQGALHYLSFEKYNSLIGWFHEADPEKEAQWQNDLRNTMWGKILGYGSKELFTSTACSIESSSLPASDGSVTFSENNDGYMHVEAESSPFVAVAQDAESGKVTSTGYYLNKISFSVVASQIACRGNMSFNVYYGGEKDKGIALYRNSLDKKKILNKILAPGQMDVHQGKLLLIKKSPMDFSGKKICIVIEENNNCFRETELCNKIVKGEASQETQALFDCPEESGSCTYVNEDAIPDTVGAQPGVEASASLTTVDCLGCEEE